MAGQWHTGGCLSWALEKHSGSREKGGVVVDVDGVAVDGGDAVDDGGAVVATSVAPTCHR